jgi:DNA-binding PadR family transcriptional regulator
MSVELFVLGFLARQGPQHGYTLRKIIDQQAADFAGIKLPTLYYHLARLEKEGKVRSRDETVGRRPERTVYELTAAGEAASRDALRDAMGEEYCPRFNVDAALFFAELAQPGELAAALAERLRATQERLEQLEAHRVETVPHLHGKNRTLALAIFDHHASHHQAERAWLERTLESMGKDQPRATSEEGTAGGRRPRPARTGHSGTARGPRRSKQKSAE